MPRDDVPAEITALADARAEARRARDWATADRLLAELASAGWKVVDTGTLYDLVRAAPPDTEEGGVVRYGSSTSVPSRLDESPVGVATVVLVATDRPDDLARTMRALVAHSPDSTQVVVVTDAPSPELAAVVAGLDAADPGAPGIVTEVVWTAGRIGWAAALNAGIRRAAAPVVILLDTSVEPEGDLVTALASALADETVAVAGPFGLVAEDVRRFSQAPEGATEVQAVDGAAIAFRRTDYAARGPLDEHFTTAASLDVWWSLVLRDVDEDAGEDPGAGATPRRAVRVPEPRCIRHPAPSAATTEEQQRLARRNHYRVLKWFATRRDLLAPRDGGAHPA
jgi:hypothetical protein